MLKFREMQSCMVGGHSVRCGGGNMVVRECEQLFEFNTFIPHKELDQGRRVFKAFLPEDRDGVQLQFCFSDADQAWKSAAIAQISALINDLQNLRERMYI